MVSNWELVKLKDVSVKIASGATPKGGQNAYAGGQFSLIRSQNIYNDRFSTNGLVYINESQASKLNNVTVQELDVLLNITGDSVARCCVVDKSVLPARVNQHVLIVRTNPDYLDAYFLHYYLVSPSKQAQLFSLASSGATRKALTKGSIENFEIKLPSVNEQRNIAGILEGLDNKIALNRRQNETLEAMAQAIFKDWFVDFGPVRAKMEGREAYLPEAIWQLFPDRLDEDTVNAGTSTLGDILEFHDSKRIPLSKKQRDQKKNGKILYPYYGAAKIMDYIDEYIFDGNYILLGEDGTVQDQQGYPILQWAVGKFWPNNHAHVISAKAPYTNFFLWCYLSSRRVSSIVTGAAQPKINQTNLKSLDIPNFNRELVSVFSDITNELFEKINVNNREIDTLAQLRDTLLPKLISGELRIPDTEQIAEESI